MFARESAQMWLTDLTSFYVRRVCPSVDHYAMFNTRYDTRSLSARNIYLTLIHMCIEVRCQTWMESNSFGSSSGPIDGHNEMWNAEPLTQFFPVNGAAY